MILLSLTSERDFYIRQILGVDHGSFFLCAAPRLAGVVAVYMRPRKKR
jgi:hypothetical protein